MLSNLSCGVIFFTSNGLVRQANGSRQADSWFASPAGMSAPELFRDAELISLRRRLHQSGRSDCRQPAREDTFRQLEAIYARLRQERTLDITMSSVHAPDSEILGARVPD